MSIQKLTEQQAVILSGFTGVLCGTFGAFHEDVEKRLSRPVMTHELANPELKEQIKALYTADFIEMATIQKSDKLDFNERAVFDANQERRKYEALCVSKDALERIEYVKAFNGYMPKHEFKDSTLVMSMATQLSYGWSAWQKARKGTLTWVSVADEEPELNTTVLIAWDDAPDVEPDMDYLDVCIDTGSHYWANYEKDKPSHWMYVPKLMAKVAG